MFQKITCMLSLLFLAPVLTGAGTADTEGMVSVSLSVQAHGVQVTENDLNAMLSASKDLLANDDLDMSFVLASNPFDSNHNVIDDGQILGCDGIKHLLKPGADNDHTVFVHIVKEIPCCDGGIQLKQEDRIVGCSGLKMPMIVLPADNPGLVPLTAIQWMHELGHNRGLQHSDCQNSIMFEVPSFVSTDLNSCERQAFKGTASNSCNMSANDSCDGMHLARRALR